jgi:hypothetical protein
MATPGGGPREGDDGEKNDAWHGMTRDRPEPEGDSRIYVGK